MKLDDYSINELLNAAQRKGLTKDEICSLMTAKKKKRKIKEIIKIELLSRQKKDAVKDLFDASSSELLQYIEENMRLKDRLPQWKIDYFKGE